MGGRWLLLLCALLPGAAAAGSGRTFPHRTLLDAEGQYWLSWGPRDGRLAFRLEVRTAGYVGFGFSPTGAMAGADIVVGGVAQGRPYLQVSASSPGSPFQVSAPPAPRPVPPSRPRSGRGCRDHRATQTAAQPRADSGSRSAPAPGAPARRPAPGPRRPLPALAPGS